jgi:glycosyltransferase involved in cell wall biosynthesis
MRILHVIASVDPKAGGPREGLRQYGTRAVALGHTVEVATLDAPGEPFLADFPLRTHALGPGYSAYRYTPGLIAWLKEHAPRYDAVIVNGIWQYHVYGAWRALRKAKVPYFVFTHGMLDPWFKHTYPLKHLKKWLFWPWAEYRLLRDARAVLFTCEEERRLASQSFWLYRANEAVVNYGTSTPPANAAELRESFLTRFPELRGKRLLLFLSRIHEKKGCDLLIEAFARVAAQDPLLHLVLAGPAAPELRAKLAAQVERLGLGARVTWPGMLQGDLKWGAFYACEAFVLPSHQENFGIAVAEALGCGVPVLISDKVNIWREIEADEAGLVAPDTVQGTADLLQRWQGLTPPQRAAMASNALRCFTSRFRVEAMASSILSTVMRRGGIAV